MTKNLKIIVLILIVLSLGVYLYYYFFQSKSSPPSESVNTGLTEVEKENAAKIMNQQLMNIPPLTAKQKEDIAKKMIESLSTKK